MQNDIKKRKNTYHLEINTKVFLKLPTAKKKKITNCLEIYSTTAMTVLLVFISGYKMC